MGYRVRGLGLVRALGLGFHQRHQVEADDDVVVIDVRAVQLLAHMTGW